MDVLGFDKLIYHYDKIEKIKQDKPQFPINLTLSLGNYCNHGCKWCTVYAVQDEQVRHADFDKYISFIEMAKSRGLKAVGYVGSGEPTAYPKFGDLVKRIGEMGIEQGMFTNGYLLDRYRDEVLENFTYFRISLDAGSTEVHDDMHRVKGHFDKIIENTAEIIKRRKDSLPTVGIQFATHQENIHDLYNSAQIAHDIGADYFSIKPVFNWGGGANKERIDPNNLTNADLQPIVSRIRNDFENPNFTIFYRPFQIDSVQQGHNVFEYDRCVAGLFNLNMYETGVLTCCSPHKVSVGTIDDDPDVLMQRIFETTKELDLSKCPPSCRYHPMNHLVDTILKPDERQKMKHSNFI